MQNSVRISAACVEKVCVKISNNITTYCVEKHLEDLLYDLVNVIE
jgi:hypothetical protein